MFHEHGEMLQEETVFFSIKTKKSCLHDHRKKEPFQNGQVQPRFLQDRGAGGWTNTKKTGGNKKTLRGAPKNLEGAEFSVIFLSFFFGCHDDQLVVEPTHLKNMLVKLDDFPQNRGDNKKLFKATT